MSKDTKNETAQVDGMLVDVEKILDRCKWMCATHEIENFNVCISDGTDTLIGQMTLFRLGKGEDDEI